MTIKDRIKNLEIIVSQLPFELNEKTPTDIVKALFEMKEILKKEK